MASKQKEKKEKVEPLTPQREAYLKNLRAHIDEALVFGSDNTLEAIKELKRDSQELKVIREVCVLSYLLFFFISSFSSFF